MRPAIRNAVKMQTPAMTAADMITARTLMSLCSCATSSLCDSRSSYGKFGRSDEAFFGLEGGSVGFMSEGLPEVRVVDRHQRPAAQVACEEEHPHAQQPDGDRDVHPVEREAALPELRSDQPDQIHEAHHDDE